MIHIFDLDHTVIRKSSAWCFLREALARRAVGISQIGGLPFEWLRYKLGRANYDFIEEAVSRIAGIEQSLLESIAEASFTNRMRPTIYRGAAELIAEARQRGEQVLFATSSLYTMIKPLECFFGITGSLAGHLEFSDGKTTGRLIGGSLFGAKKKIAAAAWLAEHSLRPEEARFYSDSYTDIPLLEYCGEAVAVNPDRFLAKEAKKRGWPVLRFTETIG